MHKVTVSLRLAGCADAARRPARILVFAALAVIIAAAATGDVLLPALVSPPAYPNVWAVLIGVDEYADPALPDLAFPARDARAMLAALSRAFNAENAGDTSRPVFSKDHALLLVRDGDLKPTAANIRFALGNWLPAHAKRDDLAIIFYSGHGWPVRDDSMPDGIKRYFLPADARKDSLSQTAVSLGEIADYIAYLPCEHALTLVDACFSGAKDGRTLASDRATGDRFWQGMASATGKIVLTASAHDQPSLEVADIESGLFTYYLVEGLSGFADANRDGILSVGELYVYARDRVRVHASRLGTTQVPQAAAITLLAKDYAISTTMYAAETGGAGIRQAQQGGEILAPGAEKDMPTLDSALGHGRLTIDAPVPMSFARITTEDGRELGANPLPLSLPLPPGEYSIEIGAKGYLPADTSITVSPGAVATLPKIALLRDPDFKELSPEGAESEMPDIVRLFLEEEKEAQPGG